VYQEISKLMGFVDNPCSAEGFPQAASVNAPEVNAYRIRILVMGPGEKIQAAFRFSPALDFSSVVNYARKDGELDKERKAIVIKLLKRCHCRIEYPSSSYYLIAILEESVRNHELGIHEQKKGL
jgi:hypothetical protein